MAGQSNSIQQQDTLNRYLLYFPRNKTVLSDVLSFRGEEELSKPYRYTIRFTSPVHGYKERYSYRTGQPVLPIIYPQIYPSLRTIYCNNRLGRWWVYGVQRLRTNLAFCRYCTRSQ